MVLAEENHQPDRGLANKLMDLGMSETISNSRFRENRCTSTAVAILTAANPYHLNSRGQVEVN